MCIEIDFLTADVRIVLLVLTPSLIFPFFPGSTNNDHGEVKTHKSTTSQTFKFTLQGGGGALSPEKRCWEKRARQRKRTRGGEGEGELSDLGTWWKGMLMLSTLINYTATAKPPFAPCDINTLKTSFVSAVVSLIKILPKSLVLIGAITLSRLSRQADSVAFSLLKWPSSGVQSAPLYYVI